MKRFMFACFLGVVMFPLVACGKPDAATQLVIDEIQNIGEVTYEDGEAIEKAFEKYNQLTDAQKEKVTNYSVLLMAKDSYDSLDPPIEYFDERPDLPMPSYFENCELDYKKTSNPEFVDYYFLLNTDSIPKVIGMLEEYYSKVEKDGFEVQECIVKFENLKDVKYIVKDDFHCTSAYTQMGDKVYFVFSFSAE